ncbi:MAG: RHS repeat-associated core domain-containing protein, partial [Eubacterium sp.]|nr:RHS repeat-associated core domain-containing protein [Eubacterium sp.]
NEYYQRTVYDNNGRIVQELDNDKYNPALDNLPNAYSDTSAGKTYEYNQYGDLIKETNNYGISTEYEYSEKGNVCRKSFDIYDYYYTDSGKCSSVAVGGDTIVNYSYDVDDFEKELKEGQKADRITYADGYIEEHITDKYGILYYKYANGKQFYGVYKDINSKRLSYYEGELRRTNTLYVENENSCSFIQRDDIAKETFTYNLVKEDNQQTVTEMHNEKTYQTVAEENKITYISENATAVYTVDGNENEAVCKISIDDAEVLVSNVSYDEESNTLAKSYGEELDYYSVYDNDGNIIGDENNSYTYNELGELISTSGLVNASYQYDSRGNMLSKTVGDNTTSYSYDNAEWKDQLTSVNGVPLTYDANGNLASYGDTTYTWSHGKQLESVTDDENLYSYKYNSSGYRVSKTVNGYTTNYDTFSGLVLAQSGREGNIYFQYNGNTPVGFILNDVQYFYITNNSGDVVGITDNAGNIIATYTYDEWGKLLSIETVEENNADQLEIAETNPLRYRGYYYDNETGYYYLQSRYYDPGLGRFISADDFDYIDADNNRSINAYIYCDNNPTSKYDSNGHEALALSVLIGLMCELVVYSMLILVLCMVFPVLISLMGEITIELPELSLPSKPKATPAEKADAKVRDTIKNNKDNYYWEATINKGGYVEIGRPLCYETALSYVVLGFDVFTYNGTFAYWLARAASGGNIPTPHDKHGSGCVGYYFHYHTNPKNGAHVFYLW